VFQFALIAKPVSFDIRSDLEYACSMYQRTRGITLLLAVILPLSMSAQRTTSSISGTITDPAGASVPDAQVRATATSTGSVFNATTNAEGFYIITQLAPDTYTVRVEKAGFQLHVAADVVLQVNRPVTMNVTLQVGSPNQTVTVLGESEQVDLRSQT